MTRRDRILFATSNPHKLDEVRAIFQPLGLTVDGLGDLDLAPPEETGETFVENARLKALTYGEAAGRLCLADDSGLVVPALGGAPGVYSARYAGPDTTDKDNRNKLLKEMARLHDEQRYAYFSCSVAFAGPEGLIRCETGTCEGSILEKERGSNGFGYDSLFLKHDYNKTLAQLDPSIKNRISHRRKALDKIRGILELETCGSH